MDSMILVKYLERLVDAFQKETIRFGFAGGLAMAVYGEVSALERLVLLVGKADLNRALFLVAGFGFQKRIPPTKGNNELAVFSFTLAQEKEKFIIPLDLWVLDMEAEEDFFNHMNQIKWGNRTIPILDIDYNLKLSKTTN